MKKFKLTFSANGKVFRSGVYSTAILAAAIVLAVLLVLLVIFRLTGLSRRRRYGRNARSYSRGYRGRRHR